MRNIFLTIVVGFVTGFLGLVVGAKWYENQIIDSIDKRINPELASYSSDELIDPGFNPIDDTTGYLDYDFVSASASSTSSVVFIQTVTEYEYLGRSIFDWFFEPRSSQQIGSGSGVIVSKDGYIVTNNHVIENADVIKVTLGKKKYDAELVGTDPSTDLAVIKIDGQNLPAIPIGKADDVKVGQWVLAVGNPFNLTSTVTAGIVSAKGRSINILKDKFPIESFIQTDAAINPGNSGGALVNQKGELIGINTAILSRTGSYAGYGFAVPVDIVNKVYKDLVQYGEVQKAFTGADIIDINGELANKLGLEDLDGVIVANVKLNSAAEDAGLEKGDIIRKVDQKKVQTKATFEEYIGNLYPGQVINLEVQRNNKTLKRNLTLTNREGTTEMVRKEIFQSDFLKASFESVSKVEQELFDIRGGVKVIDYERRGIFAQLEIPKGYIITAINGNIMDDPKEMAEILEKISGRVIISVVDKNGRKGYFPYRF